MASVTKILSVLLAIIHTAASYSYVCNDDNSIVVSSLPATSTSFFSYQGSTICATSGDNTALTISGCSKDSPIVLAHGTYVDMASNELIGGVEIETINIMCTEIASGGVTHYIDDAFTPRISHAAELTISPTYTVSSSLNETSVFVGDPILWTINYPSSYQLQITSCSAYPGTSTGSTSVTLITDWCTSTTQLLTSFTGSGGTATSVIEAFKFYNNDNVFLQCTLLVCPGSSGSCTTSCTGKRKRSIDYEETGPDAPQPATVGAYFRIIDPYSSATVAAPAMMLLVTAVFTTLFYC